MARPIPLNASSLEQQLIELVNQVQIAEKDSAINTDKLDYVSGTYDSNTEIFTATIRMPCQTYVDPSTGTTGYTAIEYLSGLVDS